MDDVLKDMLPAEGAGSARERTIAEIMEECHARECLITMGILAEMRASARPLNPPATKTYPLVDRLNEELSRAEDAARDVAKLIRPDEKIDNGFKAEGQPFRRFYLRRLKDETGISRTGRVLEGVLTQSGKVFVEWRPPMSTMGIYNSFQEFMTIHVDCHPSCNEVVWLDSEPSPAKETLPEAPFWRAIKDEIRVAGVTYRSLEAIGRFYPWAETTGDIGTLDRDAEAWGIARGGFEPLEPGSKRKARVVFTAHPMVG